MRKGLTNSTGKLKGRDQLGSQDVGKRVILVTKWILRKEDCRHLTEGRRELRALRVSQKAGIS
jgi:hypothetical protein